MRVVLLVVLCVGCTAGTKGDPGSMGANGEQGQQGEQGPAGPRGERGDTGPKGDTGTAGAKGDPGNTVLVPHLMAGATDLGQYLAGSVGDLAATTLGGEVVALHYYPQRVGFTGANCTGTAFLEFDTKPADWRSAVVRFISPDGKVRKIGADGYFAVRSAADVLQDTAAVVCVAGAGSATIGYEMIDTGSTATWHLARDLSLAFR